jgi:hypothetical protein
MWRSFTNPAFIILSATIPAHRFRRILFSLFELWWFLEIQLDLFFGRSGALDKIGPSSGRFHPPDHHQTARLLSMFLMVLQSVDANLRHRRKGRRQEQAVGD